MVQRLLLASLAVLVFGASPAAAQVNMQWKLKEGEKFYLEEKMVSKTTVNVMGNTVDTSQTMSKITEVVVKKVARDSMVLDLKVIGIESKSEMMGVVTDAGDDLRQIFEGVTFTITMTPEGKPTKFAGYDQFVKNIDKLVAGAEDPGKAMGYKMIKSMLNEDTLKASTSSLFDVLPIGSVKAGDTWKRDQAMSLGPLGQFKIGMDLTYQGPGDGGNEKIDVKGTFSHEPAKADDGESILKIIKLDLKDRKVTGQLLFNKAASRLSVAELKVNLVGSMTIEAMGNEITFEMQGSETRTTRVLDKLPKKE